MGGLRNFFRKVNEASNKRAARRENNKIRNATSNDPVNFEKQQELLASNKKSKKYCKWILVLLLPICTLAILFTIETFSGNFLFIFLAIGVWVGLSLLLQKARQYSSPQLGLKAVALLKLTTLLCIIAICLSLFLSVIFLVT